MDLESCSRVTKGTVVVWLHKAVASPLPTAIGAFSTTFHRFQPMFHFGPHRYLRYLGSPSSPSKWLNMPRIAFKHI